MIVSLGPPGRPPTPVLYRTPSPAGAVRQGLAGPGILLPEEETPMTERQKETWAGIVLTAMIVGILLRGWLILRWAVS